MSERIIAQHMHDRRNGWLGTVPLPATTCLLAPTSLPSGKLVSDDTWARPGASIASRLPPARSKGFCRGSVVSQAANRALVYESALERDFACILLADRRIAAIHDQPPPVTYRTADGVSHRHTFDFLVTTVDGRRLAFAVKPLARVEKSGIKDILALAAAQAPRDFADRFLLRTERQITKDRAFNARLILRSRRGRNDNDVETLRQLASSLRGSVSIRELVAASGFGARGWNSVICLIDEGVLNIVANSRIDERSRVRCVAQAEG